MTSTEMTEQDRFSRQRDLVPMDRLSRVISTVIGVGAIGRQIALQLAAIGAPHIQLVDFDVVDRTNHPTQGYLADDVGQPDAVETTSFRILRNLDTVHNAIAT